MKQIIVISLRELTRLTRRFHDSASPLAFVVLIGALVLAFITFRQSSVLGSGLYRVAVSGDVPTIQDNRFAVQAVDPAQAQALLDAGEIDVWIDGAEVHARPDEKSQFAIGALRRHLEKLELARIGETYEAQQAFPLRVGVAYLYPPDPNSLAAAQATTTTETTSQIEEQEVIIPSLMTPKAPFGEVLLAMLYILPVTFISIFFTSSFMEEKLNRRLTILLSAPITPFQIIIGKMLPYAIFAMLSTVVIALLTNAPLGMALAIYTPTILFIFAIYLMVPLFYRTFKDTTFISMLVTTLTTSFLVFPAMFNGVSDMAYMSPLTLAARMYQHEPIGLREYLLPSAPMAAIFGLAVYTGVRLLNEEFLMGYRPLTRKLKDAIFLMMHRAHPYLSTGLFSLMLIPVVYFIQLVALAFATNLPANLMLAATLLAAALVEEVVKSISIRVWLERRVVHSVRQVLGLSLLSALGFLIGEKLLLFLTMGMVSQSQLAGAMFSTGLLIVPLLAHFVFTAAITISTMKLRVSYPIALLVGAALHSIYNWAIMGGL